MMPTAPAVENPLTRTVVKPQPEPQTLEETGLSADLITQLILKTLHFSGAVTGGALAAKLGLSHSAIEPILVAAEAHAPVPGDRERRAGRGPSFVYRITDAGPQPRHALPRAEPLRRRRARAVRAVPEYMKTFAATMPKTATRDACARPSATSC